jgi:biotin carboxylase
MILALVVALSLSFSGPLWSCQDFITNLRRVIVVDPYSSGSLYAAAAKELGYEIIALHSKSEVPPVFTASYQAQDFEGSREIFNQAQSWDELLPQIKELAPDFIVPGTDTGVVMADYLSERLNLSRRNDFELSEARKDKFLSNMVLKSHEGIRSAKQMRSIEWSDVLDWKKNIHPEWPVVVKPTHGAGSENVAAVDNMQALEEAFWAIRNKPFNSLLLPNREVVVQEFLEGTEYIVEFISSAGKHHLAYIMEYENLRLANGSFVKQNTRLLSQFAPEREALEAYGKKVLDALGFRYGPAHLEIKVADWTHPDPVLVEPNPRMAGALLPALIKEVTGLDEARLSLLSYADPQRFHEEIQKPWLKNKLAFQVSLVSKKGGRILSAEDMAFVRSLKSYRDSSWHFKVGEEVEITKNLINVLADVDLFHEDIAVLNADYAALLEFQSKF